MSCCTNPTNLGCFDSCETVTIETIVDYLANELYLTYNFNGAIKKALITEVNGDGSPMIDLSTFNEDYNYTFEIFERATGDSLGCFKMKVEPCAGDFFDAPALPAVDNYIDSTIIFGAYECNGETTLDFVVDVADPQFAALQNGSIINLAFTATVPVAGMDIVSADTNLVVVSPSQVKIIDASLLTSIALILKLSDCVANTITGVVTSFTNLAPSWGNGTHTQDSINIY